MTTEAEHPLVGVIVRYGEADWSLMEALVVEPDADSDGGLRVYGRMCCGGIGGADIDAIDAASEEDLDMWHNCRRYRG